MDIITKQMNTPTVNVRYEKVCDLNNGACVVSIKPATDLDHINNMVKKAERIRIVQRSPRRRR